MIGERAKGDMAILERKRFQDWLSVLWIRALYVLLLLLRRAEQVRMKMKNPARGP